MSPAGYDLSQWRDTLLKLGQTRVFFSTTATLPYRSESRTSGLLMQAGSLLDHFAFVFVLHE